MQIRILKIQQFEKTYDKNGEPIINLFHMTTVNQMEVKYDSRRYTRRHKSEAEFFEMTDRELIEFEKADRRRAININQKLRTNS